MRLIGIVLAVIVLVIALWLVFNNPKLGGVRTAPVVVAPAVAPPVANTVTQNKAAEVAAEAAQAAARAKAAKAAAALAAQRAAEAAQADALEEKMTPAQNRLNEDYAAQVGDTRLAPTSAGDSAAPANADH